MSIYISTCIIYDLKEKDIFFYIDSFLSMVLIELQMNFLSSVFFSKSLNSL